MYQFCISTPLLNFRIVCCSFSSGSLKSFQFNSVTHLCLTFCDPMDCSTPGLPVHPQFLELAQTHVHQAGDAIQTSHSLSSPSPPALNLSQHQGLFQWVSSSHWVTKYWSFSFSISPSNEYSELIFFRIDWFDLLTPFRETIISSAKEFYIRVQAKPSGNGSRELSKAQADSQVPAWVCGEKTWWQVLSLEEKQLSVQAGGGGGLGLGGKVSLGKAEVMG